MLLSLSLMLNIMNGPLLIFSKGTCNYNVHAHVIYESWKIMNSFLFIVSIIVLLLL